MQTSKTVKRMITFLLAATLSVGTLAGCSGGEAKDPAQTPAESKAAEGNTEGGDATIRIAWWGNQVRNDTTVAMLDAYKAEKPGVNYEAEFTDWSGYWDKLATQAASNNLPDIIQQDYSYIAQYQSKGQLADLSTYVDGGKLDVTNVDDSILTLGKFDDKLYALCAGVNAVGMLYNTKAAKDAGVEVPMRPTYEELAEISKTVFEKTGMKSETAGSDGALSMMGRDMGEKYYDVANKKMGVSDATVLKYFTHVKNSIDQEWHISVDILQEASTAGVEASPISTGKSFCTFPGGSNMMAAHQAPIEDELAMVMFPKRSDATQDSSMYLRPAMFWSVTEASANKDVAVDIINYYTNSEKAQDLLKAERGVPVSGKMAEYLKPSLEPVQQKIFDYVAEVTKIAVPAEAPAPTGSNEVSKLLNDLTDMVRYGELSPEDAAARFLPEADAILAKAEG